MKLTKEQFRQLVSTTEQRHHNLIFLGMSGVGKTHWSKLIGEQFSMTVVEFDELIGTSTELAALIEPFPGRDEGEKMGNYFGMPWDEQYAEKEKQFLAIEKRFMQEVQVSGGVLDLTGSAIYHPNEIEPIIQSGLAIYLEASVAVREQMMKTFLENPKPVAWQGVFEKQPGEDNETALQRCYPKLLESRANLYEKYSDVVVPYEAHKSAKNAEELVETIAALLE